MLVVMDKQTCFDSGFFHLILAFGIRLFCLFVCLFLRLTGPQVEENCDLNVVGFNQVNKSVCPAITRPVARIFRTGVTLVAQVQVCMHKQAKLGGCGGMLPQENFRN